MEQLESKKILDITDSHHSATALLMIGEELSVQEERPKGVKNYSEKTSLKYLAWSLICIASDGNE